MLDQNTDRLWYVIGAVLLGAAIILLLNGAAPQLFASVGETFQSKAEKATESAEEINKNYFDSSLALTDGVIDWYSGEATRNERFAGNVITGFIPVTPGETYQTSFDAHVYYYDENKQYIGAYENVGFEFDVPGANATYRYTQAGHNVVMSETPAYIRLRYGGSYDPFLGDHSMKDIVITKVNEEV